MGKALLNVNSKQSYSRKYLPNAALQLDNLIPQFSSSVRTGPWGQTQNTHDTAELQGTRSRGDVKNYNDFLKAGLSETALGVNSLLNSEKTARPLVEQRTLNAQQLPTKVDLFLNFASLSSSFVTEGK